MIQLPYIERIQLTEEAFIEIKISEAKPQPKFSIALIKNEKRVYGIDNHENRPPHIHIRNKIQPYEFTTVEKLIEDFYTEFHKYLD